MFVRKIQSLLQRKAHAARNQRLASALPPIARTELGGGLLIQGCPPDFYEQFERFYLTLEFSSEGFLAWHRPFLRQFAHKLVFLVGREVGSTFQPLGVTIYYFNERDELDETIHEAYIGLNQDAQGLGLGTQLRSFTIAHFQACGFKGISSKISADNTASLHSAQKNSFEIVEEFHDPGMQRQRYYLVRPFEITPAPQMH